MSSAASMLGEGHPTSPRPPRETPPLTWGSYVLASGSAFRELWEERASGGGRILLVAGLGFDPRMPRVLQELAACSPAGTVDLRLLRYDEGPDSISQQYTDRVIANEAAVSSVVREHGGKLESVTIPLVEDERRVGGWRVGQCVSSAGFSGYRDVVVDISALPRTLYFPLIRALLQQRARGAEQVVAGPPLPSNLHVALVESPSLDAAIQEELTERADYLPGFKGTVELQQDEDMPRIWAPVLGEGQEEALRLIDQKIRVLDNPPEICPVLPFPAGDPRRGDQLLVQYRALFTAWGVDLRNIIYASEHNPFHVYRQLCRLHDQYLQALEPLRGAKMIVSAHSSKLLSLGALLAAYDRDDIAVAHVEAQGYRMAAQGAPAEAGVLHDAWIAGEPYDA